MPLLHFASFYWVLYLMITLFPLLFFPFLSLSVSPSLSMCQSCWRWCASPSSIRPICWTWSTTRSWSNPRRRAAIWSMKPSATTCCPTHGRRCRRQGPGRGSLLVRCNTETRRLCTGRHTSTDAHLSLAWLTSAQGAKGMICHPPAQLTQNILPGSMHPHTHSLAHTRCSYFTARRSRRGQGSSRRPWPATPLYWFMPTTGKKWSKTELYNIAHTTAVTT